MKQDQEEAKHNVEKRLEWIDGEMFVLFVPCAFGSKLTIFRDCRQ